MAVVFVHGAGHAGRMWKAQVEALSDRHTVVAPDLPGFAGTPGPFSVDAAAEQVGALVGPLDPPVTVVGHSLGGVVAMTVAAAQPERVARLVVSATPIAPGSSNPWIFRAYRLLPGFVVRALIDVPDRAEWLNVVDAIAAVDVRPLLPALTMPTLVLCGAKDKINLPDSRTLAGELSDAELVVVPDAGHLWPVTMPAEFTRIIEASL